MKRLLLVSAAVSSLMFFGIGSAGAMDPYTPVFEAHITKAKHNHSEGEVHKAEAMEKKEQRAADKESEFEFSAPHGPAYMVIVNGGVKGKDARVSSAKVELNGVRVAGPADFNKNVDKIVIPDLWLNPDNALEVEIDTCDKCEVDVFIYQYSRRAAR